jgi:hypothetical protein
MNGKKRLRQALLHREGPLPVDFGATATTGIHVSIVEELRNYFALDRHPVKVIEPYQMLGEVEADLLDALGVDVVGVQPPASLFGFQNRDWKEWRTPWGQTVLVPGGFVTTREPDGTLLIYPEGDTTAPASGKLPAGGYFFDSIIRQGPIAEEELDPEDNLEEFTPADKEILRYFEQRCREAGRGERGVIVNFGGTGLGDIALVPAPFLKHPKGIRDVTEWYISTVSRQKLIHAIFERQTDIALENLRAFHARVGEIPDVMYICGTDFGTQTSTFCSPETFRELYLPYYRKMTNWIHQNTSWKVFKHSCGSVAGFMELFIESGFDILNPLQFSAAGMDPADLKKNTVTNWFSGAAG